MADLGKVSEIKAGEDIVFLTSANHGGLFGTGKNKNANWDFGEYTDISKVTILKFLLNDCESFNGKLDGNWDTSNVTLMTSTFMNAKAFDQDISGWNTSNVTDFLRTFKDAKAFNQDISSWDVSSAGVMWDMFNGASAFNQDIGAWNTKNVRDMALMFFSATDFNQDLTDWCVSNVTQYTSFSAETSMPEDLSNDPIWGTCPRGEDKP